MAQALGDCFAFDRYRVELDNRRMEGPHIDRH
jgi:hypothetical protein